VHVITSRFELDFICYLINLNFCEKNMTKSIRPTTQEQITQLTEKLKQLKALQKNPNKKLTKSDIGVPEAIAALQVVANSHKLSFGEVVKAISSVKRTGLRIQEPAPKTRKGSVQSDSN